MAAKWRLEGEYIQSCNCDYGCPCNFDAYPTRGHCEALAGYRITKGSFDGTTLDGVKFAWGLWWPKAIHEGNGAGRGVYGPGGEAGRARGSEGANPGENRGGGGGVFPAGVVQMARREAGTS